MSSIDGPSPVLQFTVPVPWGVVHVRSGSCRSGPPVVLLHQTPRSGDEFREVIQALGADHHLLAVDLPGMGHSSPHPDGDTIAAYASGVTAALDLLPEDRSRADRFTLVGHHTGAAVAATIAGAGPERVAALVLSSPPWIDEPTRQIRRARTGPGVDEVTPADDGSHLLTLWNGRSGFYPVGRRDLLERFVADALLAADPGAGHRAVTEWQMEPLLPILRTVPVLLIDHEADPHAHPNISRWATALPGATVATIPDGMVPLEYTADAFIEAISELDPR